MMGSCLSERWGFMKCSGKKSKRNPGVDEILAVRILRSADLDLSVQAQRRRAEAEVEKQFVDIRRGAEEAENIIPEILEQFIFCV